jgi:ribose-phosphate pyrophosphokinase
MIIVAGNSHFRLARDIARRMPAKFAIANTKKFDDQELKVQLDGELYEKEVMIVQSTSKPANDHLMELLLLADTARRAGAKNIIAIIPYFGYSRQDTASYAHEPISANLVARLIETAGIDTVMTIDLHSKQSEKFFKIGLCNLDPVPLFVSKFACRDDYVVVSPDAGALPKAKVFAMVLQVELVMMSKSRRPDGECIMTELVGQVKGKHCIIVDDIVDTGSTLYRATALLRENGARLVSSCVTHGVFSTDALDKLKQANFDCFYVTDTINHSNLPSFITVIPIAELIASALHSLRHSR